MIIQAKSSAFSFSPASCGHLSQAGIREHCVLDSVEECVQEVWGAYTKAFFPIQQYVVNVTHTFFMLKMFIRDSEYGADMLHCFCFIIFTAEALQKELS